MKCTHDHPYPHVHPMRELEWHDLIDLPCGPEPTEREQQRMWDHWQLHTGALCVLCECSREDHFQDQGHPPDCASCGIMHAFTTQDPSVPWDAYMVH